MADLFKIAQGLTPPAPKVRVRWGKIVSVQSDRTATVTVGGSTEEIAGVKYMEGMTPKPNAVVTMLTDGTDLLILDHVCASNMSLTPRAHRAADQSIATATDTLIDWTAVNNDDWGCWAASPNPSRLTAPITGRYMVIGAARFEANATGLRAAWIQQDGTTTIAHTRLAASPTTPTQFQVVSAPLNMTAGQYVEMYVRQTSGGALAFSYDNAHNPSMSLIYLG